MYCRVCSESEQMQTIEGDVRDKIRVTSAVCFTHATAAVYWRVRKPACQCEIVYYHKGGRALVVAALRPTANRWLRQGERIQLVVSDARASLSIPGSPVHGAVDDRRTIPPRPAAGG